MIEAETELRAWGRSLGVVIPKQKVVKEGMKAGESVKVLVFRKNNALKETFGKLKLKRSTEEILKELDREAWDE